MKKFTFISLIIIGVFFFSCADSNKNQSADIPNSDNTETQTTNSNLISGKYQIKSGVITYTSKVMGMDQTTVITFDDFGKKEVTDTYTESMGIKLHDRTITKDGFAYNLNMIEKRGSKVKMYGTGSAIDYSNLTKEMEEKMNLKKLGKETFLGKECDIYSFDYKAMSTSGKTWVWNGVALKSVVKAMGMEVTLTGKSFEENPLIEPSIFEVPDGFEIIER